MDAIYFQGYFLMSGVNPPCLIPARPYVGVQVLRWRKQSIADGD